MSTYDPVSTATALAESYVYARQTQLDTSSTKKTQEATALTSLKSSLTTFTSALTALTSKGNVIAQTASVSNAAVATATVGTSASAGNYSFEVTQLASAQQSLYSLSSLGLEEANLDADGKVVDWPDQPTVAVSLGDSGFFSVDLSSADTDGNGVLSATEVARAINAASEGKVTAAVVTNGAQQQIMLNAGSTGSSGAFGLYTLSSGMSDSNVQAWLSNASRDASVGAEVTAVRQLAEAKDAEIWVGGQSSSGESGAVGGFLVTQSSNTYTGIEGLSMEFKQVTSSPITVQVAKDESATQANMQRFVDAYNSVVSAIDKLSASGNSENGVSAGALANDSGIRSLRTKLNSLLRTEVDGVSLMSYGISSTRSGSIELDSSKLAKKVASNPDGLTALMGQTNTLDYKRSGVTGSMQSYMDLWTNTTGGLLKARQDSLQKQQTNFTKQQSDIDNLYEQAYQRYLTQFTTLSNLESQMSSTTNLLTALFSSDSDS